MPRMASVLAAMAVVAGGPVAFGAVLFDQQTTEIDFSGVETTTDCDFTEWSDLAAVSGLVDEGDIPLSPTTDFGFFEEEPEEYYQITMFDDSTDIRDAIDHEIDVTTIDYYGGEPLTEAELLELASQSGVAEEPVDGEVIYYLGGEVEITSSVPEPTAIAAALAMATAACAVGRRSRR